MVCNRRGMLEHLAPRKGEESTSSSLAREMQKQLSNCVTHLAVFKIQDNIFPISRVRHFTTSLKSLAWLHFMNNGFFIPQSFQGGKKNTE